MTGRAVILFLGFAFAAALAPASARAVEGVITTPSSSDVKTTTDRLQKHLTDKGITIFARIDHAGAAKSIGQTLRPMELLVFGNPKLGTPLIQKNPEIGLDLPLKALVYQGENGTTYIAYTDPAFLAKRYGIAGAESTVTQIAEALKGFAAAAAK
jgi:uncharacterized protein (DUF302 family)